MEERRLPTFGRKIMSALNVQDQSGNCVYINFLACLLGLSGERNPLIVSNVVNILQYSEMRGIFHGRRAIASFVQIV